MTKASLKRFSSSHTVSDLVLTQRWVPPQPDQSRCSLFTPRQRPGVPISPPIPTVVSGPIDF